MNGTRYLVAVCPNAQGADPEIRRLQAFVAEGAQVVNITASIWHAPKIVLDEPSCFTMLRWDGGDPDDTNLRRLSAAVDVDLGAEVG